MEGADLITWIEAEIEHLKRGGWEEYTAWVGPDQTKEEAWECRLKSDEWMLEMLKDAQKKSED